MSKYNVTPVNEAIQFGHDEIIVSKTDLKGRLLYANDVFCRVAEMSTREVIGQPHSIIRHPDMPRIIFKFLWDAISAGEEIFAYVKNMSKTGKYYWVIAHVTPSFDGGGNVTGYHSTRRTPSDKALSKIIPLYQQLTSEEGRHNNGKDALAASMSFFQNMLDNNNQTYSEFIWAVGD